jgi:hypothetical protein
MPRGPINYIPSLEKAPNERPVKDTKRPKRMKKIESDLCYVAKSMSGLGLFANAMILEDEEITRFYISDELTHEEAGKVKPDHGHVFDTENRYYYAPKPVPIDELMNLGVYANSSNKNMEPNCEVIYMFPKKSSIPRYLLIAIRDIQQDEELLWDYGK